MEKEKIQTPENKSAISSFFIFKNKETEKEIEDIISRNEGVIQIKVDQYLAIVHGKKQGSLYVQAKDFIRIFRKKNPLLTWSNVRGLFETALNDLEHELLHRGDQIIKEYTQNASNPQNKQN